MANTFRIAVVGGGISGLATALAINHHCKDSNVELEVNVYEQAAQYAEIGAGVAIGVNAAKLLHYIGLSERLNAIAGDRNNVWISFRRYDNSSEIITIPANDTQTVRQLPVHRAELLDVLYNAVKERKAATLHTAHHCCGVSQDGAKAVVDFQNGSAATADLVIGCDGIHSSVRQTFITEKPVYSGRIAYRGLVPIDEIKESWPFQSYSASFLGPDRHMLVFPISQNKLLNVVAFVTVPHERLGDLRESWSSIGSREDLARDFEGFNDVVQKIIALMPATPSRWVLNDREPLQQWVDGRVVLVGDAAHAMLPHQGAGAGQSIEDGWILGRSISEYFRERSSASSERELAQWLKLYQSVRLPRAQKAQQTAREAGNVYEMQAAGMEGLSYDECLPLVAERLRNRMKWVWTEDIDEAYELAKCTP